LNITVTDQGQCKKQLRLEIPGDAVKTTIDKVATDMSRKISVAGFRPGHVPKSIIKTRFRKELRDEVTSQLIPPAFDEAIHENGLRVVGEPALDGLVFGDDESLSATFTVEVVPDFELAPYKGLPLTKRVYKVTDAEVDEVIERMRKNQGELVPVEDRAAQLGDNVLLDIEGQFADESGQTNEQKDLDLELGGQGVLEEFTRELTGVRPGETKTFSVSYPQESSNPRLSGKTINYTANIKAVRRLELPEIDEDFASAVDEQFKTVDALKAHVRSDLELQAAEKSESELRAAAISELLSRNQFEVPDVLVKHQATSRVKSFARNMQSRGLDIRNLKLDWDQLIQAQTERAQEEVKSTFILEKIADAENIEPTQEEIDAEIEDLALASGKSVESVRASLTKENALDSIKEQIEKRKALGLVIASSEMKTEEVEGVSSSGEGGQAGESSGPSE
jgi:trigger factor